jgi:hypothetical protein
LLNTIISLEIEKKCFAFTKSRNFGGNGRITLKRILIKYGIILHLIEIVWGGADWIDLALVNAVIKFCVPQNVGKFLSS